MELLRYVLLLRRWIWLLILGPVLAGGAAFLVSREMTPEYEAATRLLIEQAPTGNSSADYSAILSSERLARTYAQLLTTRPVLGEVITSLDLGSSPDQLARQVRVTPVRDTQLIVVTVEDTDPARAALIANQIAAVFGAQNREAQAERFSESKASLGLELSKLQADIDKTQAAIDALKGSASQAERGRLEDALAQYRSSYTTVLKSLEEVRLAEAQQASTIRVAEEAIAPRQPVRPRTLFNTVLAALVGLLLSVGLALLVEYLNDRVRQGDEAADLLGTSALASVGTIAGKAPPEMLVVLREPYARASEAYQMLRVRLEIARFEQPLRTLLVTSANQGEGKSVTAANLAVAMARAGKRVLLVDTDLRRPSLHRFFNHHNLRGVTTALLRDPASSIEAHCQATPLDNLLLLPSGPLPADPAALLSSPRMAGLVADLRQLADVVIFDSPPLLAVADATVLAHTCDATVMLCEAGKTRSGALRRAGELLVESGCNLAGVVVNRAAKEHGGYGNYGYYYGEESGARKTLGRTRALRRRGDAQVEHEALAAAIVAETAVIAPEHRNGTGKEPH